MRRSNHDGDDACENSDLGNWNEQDWLCLERLSLDGELLRELGGRQDPPLGALILIVSGPLGLSSLFCFILFYYLCMGNDKFCGQFSPSYICFHLPARDMIFDVKTLYVMET